MNRKVEKRKKEVKMKQNCKKKKIIKSIVSKEMKKK